MADTGVIEEGVGGGDFPLEPPRPGRELAPVPGVVLLSREKVRDLPQPFPSGRHRYPTANALLEGPSNALTPLPLRGSQAEEPRPHAPDLREPRA